MATPSTYGYKVGSNPFENIGSWVGPNDSKGLDKNERDRAQNREAHEVALRKQEHDRMPELLRLAAEVRARLPPLEELEKPRVK